MGGTCAVAWKVLEVQLHRKFDLTAGVRAVDQTEEAGGSGTSSVHAGGANATAACAGAVLSPPACRNAEDRRVGEVEELTGEGQVHRFGDGEVFGDAEVRCFEAGSAQRSGLAVAELAVVGRSNGGRVEVDLADARTDLHGLHGDLGVHSRNAVRTRLVGADERRGRVRVGVTHEAARERGDSKAGVKVDVTGKLPTADELVETAADA